LARGDQARAHRLLAEAIGSWSGLCAAPPPSGPAPDPRAAGASPGHYVFRREGDYWAVAGEGRLARVRGRRGFDYVAELLRHPLQPIYVVDLAAVEIPDGRCFSLEEAAEQGLRVSGEVGLDEGLDRRARADYRGRWRELLAEEAEARRDNDVGRAARVRREIDMLASELATAPGGTGGRRGPSFKERARVNVRNCITGALRTVRRHDETLWRHLINSIKTGTFCCYAPDRAVEWEL
jgi:non-specific serine/threonine protein kinase